MGVEARAGGLLSHWLNWPLSLDAFIIFVIAAFLFTPGSVCFVSFLNVQLSVITELLLVQ